MPGAIADSVACRAVRLRGTPFLQGDSSGKLALPATTRAPASWLPLHIHVADVRRPPRSLRNRRAARRGRHGEVYRARDTRLKREVALKILPESFAGDPDRLARFQREAEVLASLKHPNIGAIYGFEEQPAKAGLHDSPTSSLHDADVGAGFSRPVRALVLELIEGDTLAERIAHGAIPVDEALVISAPTCGNGPTPAARSRRFGGVSCAPSTTRWR